MSRSKSERSLLKSRGHQMSNQEDGLSLQTSSISATQMGPIDVT